MEYKFEVRNTNDNDYKELLTWWKYHRFKAPPFHILPDDKSQGLMVSYNGVNLCAGFVYRTSSSALFWTEFIVSNFTTRDREIRKQGLIFLINGLNYMAKEMGAEIIYTSVISPSLMKRYLDCGYIEGSKDALEMIKIIKSE